DLRDREVNELAVALDELPARGEPLLPRVRSACERVFEVVDTEEKIGCFASTVTRVLKRLVRQSVEIGIGFELATAEERIVLLWGNIEIDNRTLPREFLRKAIVACGSRFFLASEHRCPLGFQVCGDGDRCSINDRSQGVVCSS